MGLNRREVLRWGAVGAAGAMLSSAASSVGLPSIVYAPPPVPRDPLAPLAPAPTAPAGIDPALFQKAKAALDLHRYQVRARDFMGIVDFSKSSGEARFHVVDLMNGTVESHLVAHGRGSDPDHSGFVERFSNAFGSYATSNGAYTTGDYYHGQVRPFDEGPRPRLDEQQCRGARHRHSQRLVCRARNARPARQARPLGRLLRVQPRRASGT